MAKLKVSDIELNKVEIRLLRRIKKNKSGIALSNIDGNVESALECKGLLYHDLPEYLGKPAGGEEIISIKQEGKDWIEYKITENKRFWFPIIISVAALAISVFALLKP